VSGAIIAILVACATSALAQPAEPASHRHGVVRDALSDAPVADVIIRIGDEITRTDRAGRYRIALPAPPYVLEVHAPLPDGSVESMRQRVEWVERSEAERTTYLFVPALSPGDPVAADPVGLPLHARPSGREPAAEPIDLWDVWRSRHPDGAGDPTALTLPELLPDEIRVGRRDASSCADGPILRVESVGLEAYVPGVVTAEIGVFRALTTGEATQADGFRTFSIAARSYALWFWAGGPDDEYHLDDTACNQRFIDGPYPDIIVRAAQETEAMVLVQRGSPSTIDKFEYAASCGRHGTRPEYDDGIIPDVTGGNACTSGGWCGHNNCAAHQDNPEVPGDDRCLVRGICQWGTAERSARGDSHLEILAHYQPNLEVRNFGEPAAARLLGFAREGSVTDGAGIAGATVALDTGESTTTDGEGFFSFDEVEPGVRTVSYSAVGFVSVSREKEVLEGIENWASVALVRDDTPAGDAGPGDVGPTPDTRPREDASAPVDAASDASNDTNEGSDRRLDDVVVVRDAPAQDERGDLISGNPDSAAPVLSRFAPVGPEGLGDSGCRIAASTGQHAPNGCPTMVLLAVLIGWAYTRHRRTPRDRSKR